mgnify:CR=1 FL=1
MKKRIILLLAFLFSLSIICGCSSSSGTFFTGKYILPRYHYDMGETVSITSSSRSVEYKLHYNYYIKDGYSYFTVSISNKGAKSILFHPSCCIVLDPNTKPFTYEQSKTQDKGFSTIEPYNSTTLTIAFLLPKDWQDELYYFLIDEQVLYFINGSTIEVSYSRP